MFLPVAFYQFMSQRRFTLISFWVTFYHLIVLFVTRSFYTICSLIKDSHNTFGHVKPEAAPPCSRRREGVQFCVLTSSQITLLAPQCGRAVLLLAPAPISFSQMKRQYMLQGASYQLRIATRDSTLVFTM